MKCSLKLPSSGGCSLHSQLVEGQRGSGGGRQCGGLRYGRDQQKPGAETLLIDLLLPKVWQWIRHRAALEEGGFVTTNLVRKLVAEVVVELGGLKEVTKPVIMLIFPPSGSESWDSADGGGHLSTLSRVLDNFAQ